jgi:NCS2 family nucleobase:cation symporter-2/xanthine permease XanP
VHSPLSSPDPGREVLICGPDDPIRALPALLVALQQVAAMLVGVVTPVLLLAGALKFAAADTAYLVSMALLAAAIGTFLQSLRWGPLGSGLLSVTGTSATFIGPLVQAGKTGGPALMFGMSLAGALVPLALALGVPWLRRAFPPLVSGVVVLLIGLSLLPKAMPGIAAAAAPGAPPWSGGAVALLVIAVVLAVQARGGRWARLSGILCGVGAGYLGCALGGWLRPPPPGSGWIALPQLGRFGFAFRWELLAPFAFLYVFTMLEAVGVMTATAGLSGLETEGPSHDRRLRGGLLADGVASSLAALIGSFPNITYAQNNGVIQMTGVASRRVGRAMALVLAVLGLFPGVGRWLTAMPPPVLGGMALLLFGLVAVSGLRLMLGPGLGQREALIIAVSIGLGLAVPSQPEWVAQLPAALRAILESGICAGGLSALILNLALPRRAGSKTAPARRSAQAESPAAAGRVGAPEAP